MIFEAKSLGSYCARFVTTGGFHVVRPCRACPDNPPPSPSRRFIRRSLSPANPKQGGGQASAAGAEG
jgi:hypothetical protein